MTDLTITVSKQELLDRITENRDKHGAIFEKALEAYKKEVLKQLRQRINQIKAGKTPDLFIRLPIPEDHTVDYEAVIDMLTMHRGEELTIQSEKFRQYVRDEWHWKREWQASTASYVVV